MIQRIGLPDRVIEQLRISRRYFFVADGGNESLTVVFGAQATDLSELVFLLLRGAQEAPQMGEAIIAAAKCLQGEHSNELARLIGELHKPGKRDDL